MFKIQPTFGKNQPILVRNMRVTVDFGYIILFNYYSLSNVIFYIWLDLKAENQDLKSQNEKLRRQLEELGEKFQTMFSDLKGLQENNEYLMEINQEFSHENDQLSADLKRYQQSFEPHSNKRKGKKN